ncbi:protein POLR1D [Chanos chanos]|uniref:Protein POLR1D n=1 Tax=Chanos chanos TaxID=29144 RepID=A0A6J2V1W2_CHACN|nr:protein POLR1D [Chanos chanos]
MDDNELERKAVEELLKETKRARTRAETMGPAGWLKCPLRSTNKRFLVNTLRSSIVERRPSGQGSTAKKGAEYKQERTQGMHHGEDKERSQKKDYERKSENLRSHRDYVPSRGHASSRDETMSRGHSSTHRSSQSSRARSRSRSPSSIRDTPPTVKGQRERTHH